MLLFESAGLAAARTARHGLAVQCLRFASIARVYRSEFRRRTDRAVGRPLFGGTRRGRRIARPVRGWQKHASADLLGLDKAYEGHVHHDIRRVGVVFQEPRLLPWMTVEDNIRLVVTHDMKPPDIRFLLETVQLGHAAALRPRQLSLGMARRVALARALAISPELLVLDEPFASLDARLGAALAESVAHWANSTGAAVIVATHDLAQAMQRVSRLLILSGVPAQTLRRSAGAGGGGQGAVREVVGGVPVSLR